jgi:hypothetical protein
VTQFNISTQIQNITILSGVTPIENLKSIQQYDKEKYKEMVLDAAETVIGFFGLDISFGDALKQEIGTGK